MTRNSPDTSRGWPPTCWTSLGDTGQFGFTDPPGGPPPDEHPGGFLTGAAGAAPALHTFATNTPPATRWDRALLLD